jgi:hypothetical protein
MIINDLCRNELRLHKNFFQPVMRLLGNERIGGRLNRKHDILRTPYQRLMDSGQMPKETRGQLGALYLSPNPCQLKRSTDTKLDNLHKTYEEKRKSHQVEL